MRKFKHRKTGEEITYKDGVIKSSSFTLEIGCEPSSEFWEEVIEKDYEILSYRTNKEVGMIPEYTILEKEKDEIFRNHTDCVLTISSSEDKLLNNSNYDIFSVKRLSDNCIFQLDDNISHALNSKISKITKINFFKNNIYFSTDIWASEIGVLLDNAVKTKVRFTTEDKIELYENDYAWLTYNYGEPYKAQCLKDNEYFSELGEGIKVFSSKEKAEKYIILNKPCLSIVNIFNIESNKEGNIMISEGQLKELKQFVKSKL